ncbi:MAG TPA: DinB family protein, partial [Ferruginibacter sp.]|nr:DinB family protein [Ferruginibacter sp.]
MANTETMIKMVLDRWYGSIKNFDAILNDLNDESLAKEIAPGKNRGIYLLGHLIAVHDDMLVLLDMGDRQYPALQEPFIKAADKTTSEIPAAAELKDTWFKQCEMLKQKLDSLQP